MEGTGQREMICCPQDCHHKSPKTGLKQQKCAGGVAPTYQMEGSEFSEFHSQYHQKEKNPKIEVDSLPIFEARSLEFRCWGVWSLQRPYNMNLPCLFYFLWPQNCFLVLWFECEM
jgi:hypothetical protein